MQEASLRCGIKRARRARPEPSSPSRARAYLKPGPFLSFFHADHVAGHAIRLFVPTRLLQKKCTKMHPFGTHLLDHRRVFSGFPDYRFCLASGKYTQPCLKGGAVSCLPGRPARIPGVAPVVLKVRQTVQSSQFFLSANFQFCASPNLGPARPRTPHVALNRSVRAHLQVLSSFSLSLFLS